jgi:hypothetical protein
MYSELLVFNHCLQYIVMCRGCMHNLQIGFGLDLLTPYTHNSGLQAVQCYHWSAHFTVHRYTLTRILCLHYSYSGNRFITVSLTLQITYEVFFSQTNSFLAIILQLPIPKVWLNSIPLLPGSCPARLASQLDSSRLLILNWSLLYNHFAWTTQKTQLLYCSEGMFTAPLHNNGSYLIVACVFFAAGMCLLSRCLAMNVCCDFTIQAFRATCHNNLFSMHCHLKLHATKTDNSSRSGQHRVQAVPTSGILPHVEQLL